MTWASMRPMSGASTAQPAPTASAAVESAIGTPSLGHASLQSTEAYLRADPTEKLEALNATSAPNLRAGRFRPPDRLLAMLSGK